MTSKKDEVSLLVLLFVPVVLAIYNIFSSFNIIDLVYLLIVGGLFIRYFLIVE